MAKKGRKRRPKRSTLGEVGQLEQKLRRRAREVGKDEKSTWEDGAWEDLAPTRKRRPRRSSTETNADDTAETTPTAPEKAPHALRGRIVGLESGLCSLESQNTLIQAALPTRLARRQRSKIAVGDEVTFEQTAEGYRVLDLVPRRTVLSRPDPHNKRVERLIAANIDVVVQVASVVRPPLRPALIDRYLIAIERGGAEALLCVNKIDLLPEEGPEREQELALLDPYRDLVKNIVLCSTKTGQGIEELRQALAGKTAAFVGHSGVGKSSLINALEPGLELATGAVHKVMGTGRHTTTGSSLHRLSGGTIELIDTPGIRELGLWRLTPEDLRDYFPDFEEPAAHCRFYNCSHSHEPGCALPQAVADGEVREARLATYLRILESLRAETSG